MTRRLKIFTILILGLFAATPALSASEALVALHASDDASWRRESAIQQLLTRDLGFDEVRILFDATPREVSGQVAEFLARPGAAKDRRLVWISGPGEGEESPCPTGDLTPVTPTASILMIAPSCFAETVALPPGTRHFGISSAAPRISREGRKPTPKAARPSIAILALPSDEARFIARADRIVFEALENARSGKLAPATLLRMLRHRFREDGSNYTPTLDAAPAGAAWSRKLLAPPREQLDKRHATVGPGRFSGRLAWPRGRRLPLYRSGEEASEPVLTLPDRRAVTVLRTNRGGTMAFVRAARTYYGWVMVDELE